jgi:hypothetical protein
VRRNGQILFAAQQALRPLKPSDAWPGPLSVADSVLFFLWVSDLILFFWLNGFLSSYFFPFLFIFPFICLCLCCTKKFMGLKNIHRFEKMYVHEFKQKLLGVRKKCSGDQKNV